MRRPDPFRRAGDDRLFPFLTRAATVLVAVLLIAVGTVFVAYQERWESLVEIAGRRVPAVRPEIAPGSELPPCAEPAALTRCPDWNGGNPLDRRPSRFPHVVSLPPLLHRQPARYTDAARARRIEGVVVLQIGIRRDGTVGGVCVLKPLPCGLDESAIEAVRLWRFQPALVGGRPADVVSTVAVTFNLDKG